ncbi:MAG: glycoside hydrolase family 2 TIM barrel-domain containing protein [bacterium]
MRKDFEHMKELGINFYRTTHYPYSQEHIDLFDEYGILIADELTWLQCKDYSNREITEKMEWK